MFFQKESKNFKTVIFVIVAVALVIPTAFFNLEKVRAQSTDIFSPVGRLEGTGTFFKLDESEYLKITLESSKPIKLSLESVPEMVILNFEPVSDSFSTVITLGGFLPLTTYHKYEDDYHNHLIFVTDEQGKYTYTQDLSKPHLVFIQPRPSTKFIKDNLTGGDCYLVGDWDISTKTCTLTKDLTETVQIDSNGITLNGNGHQINLSWTAYGVYLPYRTGVTIKNLTVTQSVSGIRLYFSNGNTIIKNIAILNNSFGISLLSSNNNMVADNTTSRNFYSGMGIYLTKSSNNIIKNNNSFSNSFFGAYLEESSNNIITDNIFNSHYSAGIYFDLSSNNNTLAFNTVSNNNYGVYLYLSNNNRVYNNNFINNTKRPIVYSSIGNIFNLPLPDGGNYWSDFDTPGKGCNDLNNDKICDLPYVFTGGQDNLPWTKKDGWLGPQNQLPQISNLNQFKSDEITQISEGNITTENKVVFKAILSDPDNDQVKLQIELKKFDQAFDESDLLESDFLASGSEAVITKENLDDGQYKWRARAVDDKEGVSDWQEFGAVGNTDFEVKTLLSYKAASLAKELVNHPEAYLWGGKGWDYDLAEFVSSVNILSGYTYYNPDLPGRNTGIGVDCSGLITWAFNRSFNRLLPAINNFVKYVNANGLYGNYQSAEVAESDLLPGDAMFFDWNHDKHMDHVAMYVGESGGYDVVNAGNDSSGITAENKDDYKNLNGFQEFRRIHEGNVGMKITAGSPIDLSVTDPDGFTVSSNSLIQSDEEYIREIPGLLYYLELEQGHDGRPIDQIYSPVIKTGDYIIKAFPAAGASPTETYNLTFQTGEQTIVLAENILLSQIPTEGYGVTISETGEINTFIPILIDIKPGSYPNTINLKSKGTTPVAILGSSTIDVEQINPATIKLAGAGVKMKGNDKPMVSYSDINKDGFNDIVAHIITEALQLTPDDSRAKLEAQLMNEDVIGGFDSVRIVPDK